MKAFKISGLSVLSVAALALGLVVAANATAPTASAQACPPNNNGRANVTGFTCTAGVASSPIYSPAPSGVIDTGPLTTCPVNYNGDIGATTYGVCDQTNGTPLVPVGTAPSSVQVSVYPATTYQVGVSALPGTTYYAAPPPYYVDPSLYYVDPSLYYNNYYYSPDYYGTPDPYTSNCFPC